ncbi:hypothetical protein ACWFR5_38500 [Streptomyces sp. NPDC055092]
MGRAGRAAALVLGEPSHQRTHSVGLRPAACCSLLDEAYGAVLGLVLHPPGRYPDTAMSVVIEDPVPSTAVAVNLQQLRSTRFTEATLRGAVAPAVMTRVDAALRAVLDL